MADWLGPTLNDYRPVEYPWRDDEPEYGDVVEGDVLVVSEMDALSPNRMVVVMEVEKERRCFFGAFVTNERSLATAEDVYLVPDQTGLPYSIAGLAGLTGWIWYAQIRRRIGVLTDEALKAISAGHCGVEGDFQSSHRGMPLQERVRDLRWPTLETEAEYLRELSRDCKEKHDDDDIALPYVDPRLLSAPGQPSHNGFHTETLCFLEKATREGRTRGFSPSCVEQVAGTLDRRILRAYPTMFQPRGSLITSPPVRRDQDDVADWLLQLTMADALAGAGFVKVIGGDEPSGSVRFDSNGKHYEFLYETVEGIIG